MNGLVACTVTATGTNVSCVIRIFTKKAKDSPPFPWWQLIGGTLFDIFPHGTQGWWKNTEGTLELIGNAPRFVAPYCPVGPIITFDDELPPPSPPLPDPFTVAQLDGVPYSFLDTVTPQNPVRGKGSLYVTNEILNWSMWYRAS